MKLVKKGINRNKFKQLYLLQAFSTGQPLKVS